jgi:F0F1-type ATP synthase assembly protein I
MIYRKFANLFSLGLVLPSSIIIGLLIGYYMDKWLGTNPWLLLVFTLLGVASGLISLIRGIIKLNKDPDIDKD